MTRARAQFKGGGEGTVVQAFSDDLRRALREFDPRDHTKEDLYNYRAFVGEGVPTDLDSPHPSEEFVAAVLSAAHSAVARQHWQQFEVGKPDLKAELNSLRVSLRQASDQLRSMSANASRALNIEADQVELANDIDRMDRYVEQAVASVGRLPSAKKPAEASRVVALTLISEVLPVLEGYGMKVGATVDAASTKVSSSIRVLQAIGDDVGLRMSPTTWRNIIQDSKKAAKAQRGPGQ